jgi:hypothetical protein
VLGLQVADLGVEELEPGQRIVFSVQDLKTGSWIEHDQVIEVVSEQAAAHGLPVRVAGDRADRNAAD